MTTTARAAFSTAIIAVAATAVLALRYHYTIIIVRGRSMAPTLREGETVLTRRVRGERVRSGDIVVIRVPGNGADGLPNQHTAVKRVAAIAGDPLPPFLRPLACASGTPRGEHLPAGQLAVLGDNTMASVDSRTWGLVPTANVLAKVIRKL